METIQVVIDSKLRKDADRLAKRHKTNRSALIRRAIQELVRREHIKELEERDRRGYEAQPETEEERRFGEGETAWLED